MKRVTLICGLLFLILTLSVIGVGWVIWLCELTRLKNPESITKEIGFTLPSDVRILETRAHIFSFVDEVNYEWLIQSKVSLWPWVTKNMSVEQGGWKYINFLSELSDFNNESLRSMKFGGVWRGVMKNRRGDEETSYFFLAEDGLTGILQTFRP